MERVTELIRKRRNVRTFDDKELIPEDLEKLRLFTEKIETPYGIPVDFKFSNAKEYGLSRPVAVGTELYVGGQENIFGDLKCACKQ